MGLTSICLFILWILGHNLLNTNARRPVKGSKDADFRLAFFTEAIYCPLGLGPSTRWMWSWGPGSDDV